MQPHRSPLVRRHQASGGRIVRRSRHRRAPRPTATSRSTMPHRADSRYRALRWPASRLTDGEGHKREHAPTRLTNRKLKSGAGWRLAGMAVSRAVALRGLVGWLPNRLPAVCLALDRYASLPGLAVAWLERGQAAHGGSRAARGLSAKAHPDHLPSLPPVLDLDVVGGAELLQD